MDDDNECMDDDDIEWSFLGDEVAILQKRKGQMSLMS